MNLHTPERHAHESQSDYRARQRASREAVKASKSLPPTSQREGGLSEKHAQLIARIKARRATTGQRPKFAKARKRPPIDTRKPHGFVIHAPQDQRAGKKPSFHNDAIRERGHAKLMRFFGGV